MAERIDYTREAVLREFQDALDVALYYFGSDAGQRARYQLVAMFTKAIESVSVGEPCPESDKPA